jgi:hypothetical protein
MIFTGVSSYEITCRKNLAKLKYELELLTINQYELLLSPIEDCPDPVYTFYYKAKRDNKLGYIEHEIKRISIELEFGKLKFSKDFPKTPL